MPQFVARCLRVGIGLNGVGCFSSVNVKKNMYICERYITKPEKTLFCLRLQVLYT